MKGFPSMAQLADKHNLEKEVAYSEQITEQCRDFEEEFENELDILIDEMRFKYDVLPKDIFNAMVRRVFRLWL